MKLHELSSPDGSTKRRRRVGRGMSSGLGKTSGRGMKGQGARAGGGTRLYHQGGNLPFFRRLPFKRGFSPRNRVLYNEVNLSQLGGFKAKSEVSPETLNEARLLRDSQRPIVLLGDGEVSVALTVKVHRCTGNARKKIEAAGGSVEILS